MSTINTIGIDLGRSTFHVVGHDYSGRQLYRHKFSREKLLQFISVHEPVMIAWRLAVEHISLQDCVRSMDIKLSSFLRNMLSLMLRFIRMTLSMQMRLPKLRLDQECGLFLLKLNKRN